MNRDEFLQKLQETLSGAVPPESVRENLRYYSSYLSEEKKKGRSEREILEELGDPRLIARTIIDTTPGAGEGNFEPYADGFGFGSFSHGEESEDARTEDYARESGHANIHYYDLNKWYWKLLGIALVVCFFMIVIAVVSGLLTLLIPLMPVILIVLFIMWLLQR